MHRNESQITRPAARLTRWGKFAALSLAVAFGLFLTGAQTTRAAGPFIYGPSYGSGYGSYGYGGYGYGGLGYGGDPFHFYSGPWNHHVGPHSAPHVGPHFHWRHGYHYGPHWQRHFDDHSLGGHWGFRPWRPH